MRATPITRILFNVTAPFLAGTLLGVLVLALSFVATAQPELRFKRIDVEDGLPHNTVLSILQDRKGFMWFATQDGLCRYDGYAFTVFRHQLSDSTSLSSNKIMSILEDREGYIWVGTQATGLNRFDPKTETFTRFLIDSTKGSGQDRLWVSELLEDQQGDIWGTTFGGGLFRYDISRNSFERFTHQADDPRSISSNDLNSMAFDEEGNIWIGAVGGLNRFDPRTRTFKRYLGGPGMSYNFSDEFLSKLFFDKSGKLWLGTYGNGMLRFDPASETVTQYRHNPVDPQSISNDVSFHKGMYEDRAGRIWISTMGGGLNIFDPASSTFSHYKNDPSNQFSISNNILAAIYEDNHGNVWLGGEGGLSITTPFENRFSLYQHLPGHPNGLSHNNIVCLLEDREGFIWVGTNSGGLNRYDRKTNTFKSYRHDPKRANSLSSDFIQSVMEDRNGDLWVGTDGGGPNRFDRETESFTRFYNAAYWQMLNDIHAIFEDKSGNFWLGTHGGLFSFDRKTGESIPYLHDPRNPQSISNDVIGRIFQDSRGTVWVSTWMGGLNRMNPRKAGETPTFISFQHDPDNPRSLSSNEISILFEDRKGILWVGTADGLNQYQPESGTFRRFGKEVGFPSTFFYGILEDEKGNLWLSTGNGLCRFNPQTGSLKVYDAKDGLQSNNFAGQFQLGAHCKSRTGELFFGGPNGFNSFFPDRIQENTHVPPVVITGFKVFNRPVKLGKPISEIQQIEIPYSSNVLSFDFAALDFRNSLKNLYAYKLEGFDKEWVDGGTHHSATYTNLPPDTYTFQVKGSNNDGVWNEEGATIRLIIQPPWWRTWWAYTFYGLCFLAGLIFLEGFQRRKLLETEREKTRERELKQAKEIEKAYHELQQTQNQLVQAEKMASLGELTAGIAHEIQNPLNFVNNFSEVSTELVEELRVGPFQKLPEGARKEAGNILEDLNQNLSKIHHHGQRADAIVKNMLQHSQASSGEKQSTDINTLAEEYLRLSYYGIRAKDKEFHASLITDFDEKLGKVNVVPQELGRVLLNLYNNAFYATQQKKVQLNGHYQPEIKVTTCQLDGQVEIKVYDNGNGIPDKVKSKIFQPFFTTKPTGQGTGLGLSLSYDIVTKGHGGKLKVETKEGEYTEMIVHLPLPAG